MSDPASDRELATATVRDHLANERTLLAWVRTAITVVGLGFIVDRLSLGREGGLEALAGVGLVFSGGLLALAGAYSYVRARRELVSGRYQPIVGLHLVVVAVVVIAAGLLTAYLLLEPPPQGV